MANNVEEAIQEAITEIKAKDWVVDAEENIAISENKPCNYVFKALDVLHQVSSGDHVYSTKGLYINLSDFTYIWHAGGGALEDISTPFRDLVDSKLSTLKTAFNVDWAEITSIDEIAESGIVTCIKGTTGNNADTYTVKVWKTGATSVDAKIISKTTVS